MDTGRIYSEVQVECLSCHGYNIWGIYDQSHHGDSCPAWYYRCKVQSFISDLNTGHRTFWHPTLPSSCTKRMKAGRLPSSHAQGLPGWGIGEKTTDDIFCRSIGNALCPEYVAGWIYMDYDGSWRTKDVKVVPINHHQIWMLCFRWHAPVLMMELQ